MKVSILSMQRVNNYGSFLQAYALKRILEDLGHNVTFLDIKPEIIVNDKENENNNNISIFNIIKKKLWLINLRIIKNLAFRRNEKLINKKLSEYRREILGIKDELIYDANSDAVVIGSDEIFKYDKEGQWGLSTQRFGDMPGVPIIISYAASCGATLFSDIPENKILQLRNSLKKLKAISVRDQNTFDFIKSAINIEPDFHLDPVLMYSFNKELSNVKEKDINNGKEEPYMIVYSYRNRIKSKNEIQKIRTYAKENKLNIYCVQGLLPWCDSYPVLSPFEVLNKFKYASCIVTDTFHGAIMAAKFNKKLAVFVRESNKNKLKDLLSRLKMDDCIVSDVNNLKTILDIERDYSITNNYIDNEKLKTQEYLKNNL